MSEVRYLDIDSTFRDRKNYPYPTDFVIPISYAINSGLIDPVVEALPFTDSSLPVGSNLTQTSLDSSNIKLSASESLIENYYTGAILEISTEFRRIISYDSISKIATVDTPFSGIPSAGTVYYTRRGTPYYIGTVDSSPSPTSTSITLDSGASSFSSLANSFIRFTSGVNSGNTYKILSYVAITRIATLESMSNTPSAGDDIEILSAKDNASTLINSSITSAQVADYEIELVWLTVPNQILGSGYGGTLDRYPYIYVSLYNEGSRESNQLLYSNNPNTPSVIFKVPVDEYFGDTNFITLTHSKTRQIVRFAPNKDIRFKLTLPNGETLLTKTEDTSSPYPPNPFLQFSALFSIRKI